MKKIKTISIFLVIVLSTLACSSEYRNSMIDRITEELGDAIPSPRQIATLVIDEVNELNNGGQGSGIFTEPQFDDIGFGMLSLESYRLRLVQSYKGVDSDGSPMTTTITNDQEVIKPLQITHLRMQTTTEIKPIRLFEIYRFGNEVYLLDELEDCSAFTENLNVLNPDRNELGLASIFSNLEIGSIKEQGVMVNGVLTDKYEVKNVAMVNATLKDVDAEIWYARDGGFIVKFVGEAQGEAYSETEDINRSGSIRWAYDLTDINAVVEIPLPQKCQLAAEGGVNEIPVPDNVQDLSKIGSMLSFNSPDAATTLAEFYRTAMPEAGYSLVDETTVDNFFVITYLKAEETITVMISGLNSGGSDAIITIEVK